MITEIEFKRNVFVESIFDSNSIYDLQYSINKYSKILTEMRVYAYNNYNDKYLLFGSGDDFFNTIEMMSKDERDHLFHHILDYNEKFNRLQCICFQNNNFYYMHNDNSWQFVSDVEY